MFDQITQRRITIDSPVGPLTLFAVAERLTGLWFGEPDPQRRAIPADDHAPIFITVQKQLDEYFAGTRLDFDIPLHASGTSFQKQVWRELCGIPYGVTISYKELAERVGNSNASRAVGLANGQNPIGIIVPCHRVIGANGKLVGYGGGLPRKIALLEFEAAVRATGPQAFPAMGGVL